MTPAGGPGPCPPPSCRTENGPWCSNGPWWSTENGPWVRTREWGAGGGVHVPWACAVPANPNTSEAPTPRTATVGATAFRMVNANVVIGLRHSAAGCRSRPSNRIYLANRVTQLRTLPNLPGQMVEHRDSNPGLHQSRLTRTGPDRCCRNMPGCDCVDELVNAGVTTGRGRSWPA
jgi:hypothetical protein